MQEAQISLPAVSPDGQLIVGSGTFIVGPDFSPVRDLSGSATAAAFDPAAHLLLTVGPTTITAIDTDSWTTRYTLSAPQLVYIRTDFARAFDGRPPIGN